MSDGYEVKAKQNHKPLIIDGKADRVSKKHITFMEKLNKPSTENYPKQKQYFRNEGKGTFRLQQHNCSWFCRFMIITNFKLII